MPELDGEATAALIKAIPQFAALPIVLLSSMGTRGTAEQMRAKGFAAALTKPVRQAQLLDVVSRILGEARHDSARQPGAATIGEALGLRVLLAEDNLVNQKVALRMLSRLGCQARAVGNGLEALAALERETYDVVLMDVQMPDMDGFEATRRIRQREAAAGGHIPVIAMTAHAMEGDRQRCLDAGMDGYLSKPVKPDEIAKVLQPYAKAGSAPAAGQTGAPADQ
jgi:two-component system, sensor histidine kinase and response regulator